MSFVVSIATPSAALATNGTLVFSYPAIPASGTGIVAYPFDLTKAVAAAAAIPAEQTSSGDFSNSNQHYAYSVGLQARLVVGVDFSLSFSDTISSGITMTYLGSTSIPAGTAVQLQLKMPGQSTGNVFDEQAARGRLNMMPMGIVRFGTPLAAITTLVLATTADVVTTLVPLTTPIVLDIPRNLQIVSSTTDTTQTITNRGLDEFGVAMTETLTLNGTTPVFGLKAFKTVTSYQASASLAGNLSIGSGTTFGMPFALDSVAYALNENMDNTQPTRGTFVKADLTVPSATTGDVRGTYKPNTAANAVHKYEVLCLVPDPKYYGLPQYGA